MDNQAPSITAFCRTLRGVKLSKVSTSLVKAGVLYWDSRTERLQPCPRYCLWHFEVSGRTIKVLPAGQKLLTNLYNSGQLIMKQGYDHYGSGVAES